MENNNTSKSATAGIWGETPCGFKFEANFDTQTENLLLEKSAIQRTVWNHFVAEASYRLELKKRVKDGTATEEEKTLVTKIDKETRERVQVMDFDTKISDITFNYLITPMRNSPAFVFLKEMLLNTTRETARLVAGGFESFKELKGNKDERARTPFFKDEETYQTIICKDLFIKKGKLIAEGVEIPIPGSTKQKIGDRKILHLIIKRQESKLYLKSTWTITGVVKKDLDMPKSIERITGLYFHPKGVSGIDSRGKKFSIAMRRPDHYHPTIKKMEGGTMIKTKGQSLREKIADLDVTIAKMRDAIKLLPKEERKSAWRALELDPVYQRLKAKRANLYETMGNRQKDYHRKLADELVKHGDLFFIAEPIIRGKKGKKADAEKNSSDKNWDVQNTGSLAECIRLFEWRCKRAGKITLKVPERAEVENPDAMAKHALLAGFGIYGFPGEDQKTKRDFLDLSQILEKQKDIFLGGYAKISEEVIAKMNNSEMEEIQKAKKSFETDRWNESHVNAVLKIVTNSNTRTIKIRIKA